MGKGFVDIACYGVVFVILLIIGGWIASMPLGWMVSHGFEKLIPSGGNYASSLELFKDPKALLRAITGIVPKDDNDEGTGLNSIFCNPTIREGNGQTTFGRCIANVLFILSTYKN